VERFSGYMPDKVREQLVVRIHKPTHNTMSSFMADTAGWALDLENKEKWTNMLMGYTSSADTQGSTGIRWMHFNNLEDAKAFCVKQGWKYEVEEPWTVINTDGKRVYAHNFFSENLCLYRATMSPKKLVQTQFGHAERGSDPWINLKHTDFGNGAVKGASMPVWKDEFPNTGGKQFKASQWYRNTLASKQELSRKIGK
jgi:hypothetical protein